MNSSIGARPPAEPWRSAGSRVHEQKIRCFVPGQPLRMELDANTARSFLRQSVAGFKSSTEIGAVRIGVQPRSTAALLMVHDA